MRSSEERDSTKPKQTKFWRVLLSTALGVLLLVWVLRKADLPGVWRVLGSVSPWAVLATILIGYVSIPLRVIQWRWLLGNPRGLGFGELLRATCLGYLGNCVLPMRGGDLVKSYLVARKPGFTLTRVLPSVVLARLQDFPPILVLLLVMFQVSPLESGIASGAKVLTDHPLPYTQSDLHHALAWLIGSIFGSGLVMALLFVFRAGLRRRIVRLVERIAPGLATRVDRILHQLSDGMEIMKSWRYLWGSQVLAFVCWVFYAIAVIPLLMAFSLDFNSACLTALTVTGLTTLAHLLPSAPGAVGTFEAFSLTALYVCNPEMDRNSAVAFTLLLHLIGTITPALPGLVYLPQAWGQFAEAKQIAAVSTQEGQVQEL